MKLALLATAIFLVAFPIPVNAQQKDLQNAMLIQQGPLRPAVTWSQCVQYIDSHSTYISPGAMNRLQIEVSAGVMTWEIFFAALSQCKSSPVSGGNVGWVDEEYIEFPSEQEALEAASLITQATLANGSRGKFTL